MENIKKHLGNKKQSKNLWKKSAALIIKQKYIIISLEINKSAWYPREFSWSFDIKIISLVWASFLWDFKVLYLLVVRKMQM